MDFKLEVMTLAVEDLEAAHGELVARGIKVGDVRHKSPVAEWAGEFAPGPDPERRAQAIEQTLATAT